MHGGAWLDGIEEQIRREEAVYSVATGCETGKDLFV